MTYEETTAESGSKLINVFVYFHKINTVWSVSHTLKNLITVNMET